MSKKTNEIWLVLTLAAIQFVHILDFVVLMPLGPVLMKDLSINSAEFGLLVSSYNFTAGVCGLLFGVVIRCLHEGLFDGSLGKFKDSIRIYFPSIEVG